MKKWYRIENKADKAEIWIYESIGEDWWTGGGVTAKDFQKELSAIKAKQIDLHINSPGGSVFDGIAIYNLLKQHSANVTTYIDGLAASIASVIALAGDKVVMAENALYMIHNPMGGVYGNANEMRDFADVLDKVTGTMVSSYVAKTAQPEADIIAMLEAETWMTADEALEHGFIDEISGQLDMAACARFVPIMAKSGFRHIPETLTTAREAPSERELERILRNSGCSARQAKALLANGYQQMCQRDVDAAVADPSETAAQRDVEPSPEPAKRDWVAELLAEAERMFPSCALGA